MMWVLKTLILPPFSVSLTCCYPSVIYSIIQRANIFSFFLTNCDPALAEAGIIPSKLLDREFASTPNVSEDQGVCFFPNRYFDVWLPCLIPSLLFFFSHFISFLPSYLGMCFYLMFCCFRFLSRQDLVSWKAKIEYEVMPGIDKEVGEEPRSSVYSNFTDILVPFICLNIWLCLQFRYQGRI